MSEYNKPLPVSSVESKTFWEACREAQTVAAALQPVRVLLVSGQRYVSEVLEHRLVMVEVQRARENLFLRSLSPRVS